MFTVNVKVWLKDEFTNVLLTYWQAATASLH